IGRLNAFMTEPERNDGDVDTSLQQMQSRGMPQHMWRNALHTQAGTCDCRLLDSFLEEIIDAFACKGPSPGTGKGDGIAALPQFIKPRLEDLAGLGPQWHRALLTSFPFELEHRRGTKATLPRA